MAYATVEELAAALRVALTDTNTPAMQACLDAAAEEIDHSIDRFEEDPVPQDDPLANRVNLLRGVEWWKSNDAAFGVIGFDDAGSLQAPRDGFRRHAATLKPLKQQYGVA